MAYRLACEIPQRLGGIVSIAGSGWLDEADCRVRDVPLSVLQVHGSDDDVMPFDGDSEAPGALEMLDRWGARDACKLRTWAMEGGRFDYAEEGATQVGAFSSGCTSGEDVRLWLLDDSDHYPTFTQRFSDDLLGWLLERL
jgi:poly(3-hydroxybutyrate) depolymerase